MYLNIKAKPLFLLQNRGKIFLGMYYRVVSLFLELLGVEGVGGDEVDAHVD